MTRNHPPLSLVAADPQGHYLDSVNLSPHLERFARAALAQHNDSFVVELQTTENSDNSDPMSSRTAEPVRTRHVVGRYDVVIGARARA